jgi:glycosyltransferase involved in cell wall biosynthesis
MAANVEWGGARSTRAARGPRVLFQGRANLFVHPDDDTDVARRLMTELARLGADVRFSPEHAIPAGTDVVHAIGLTTPETRSAAEQAERARVPFVVTTLYADTARFSEPANAAAALFRLAIDPRGGQRAALDRQALAATVAASRDGSRVAAPADCGVAERARVLLCCGPSERRRVQADHPLGRDVRVIPFGADPETIQSAVAPGAFGATYGVREFVLCVGRLETQRNQLMLLEALRDDGRAVVLVTGGLSYEPDYARLCAAFRRRGATLVLDDLPAALFEAAAREAAVHCTPSWYELPGLAALAAARLETPVAAASWGAIADYLDGTIAYCEPDDPESIRRAIETARRLDPGPAAEQAHRFTWARTASETLALYEELAPTIGAGASPVATPVVGRANGGRANGHAAVAPTADDTAGGALAAATRARAAGEWSELLRHATAAADEGAERLSVAELRAVALTHLGRLDEAEAEFASMLGVVGGSGRGETGLGIIALSRGDEAGARAWLERATALGADADAWAALGLCLGRLAQAEDAWKAYAEARRRDPASRAALHGLVTLADALDRLAELEVHLRDYLSRVGEDADVRCALASCLFAAGRNDESREAAHTVLRTAPGHTLAQTLLYTLDGDGATPPPDTPRLGEAIP